MVETRGANSGQQSAVARSHGSDFRANPERPWRYLLEFAAGGVTGAVLFAVGRTELANVAWILGGFQSVSRYFYTSQLQAQLAPLSRLVGYVDLSENCEVDDIRQVLDLYMRVTEAEFVPVRQAVINETKQKLTQLALTQRSDLLGTSEFYGWLLPKVDSAMPGDRIWAVSMMLVSEWNDSEPERRFLAATIAAADRGVRIQRIFVVPAADRQSIVTLDSVARQIEHQKIDCCIIDQEYLRRVDDPLLKRLQPGFIAFDSKVMLVDAPAVDGTAGGYITTNLAAISGQEINFQHLRQHAAPLD